MSDRPQPPTAAGTALEPQILALGRRLGGGRRLSVRTIGRRVDDRAMALVARDPELRAALFRLVDVAPACAGASELADHLGAYLEDVQSDSAPLAWGARAADSRLLGVASGLMATRLVRQTARRFIVGESVAGAERFLGRLWHGGVGATVDLLGEATVTPVEADAYADRCHDALATLAAASSAWPRRPLLEADSTGPIPRVNLSVKVTALTPLVRAEAPERGRADAAPHLRRLLREARDLGAHLHVDMESLDSRKLICDLVLDLLDEPEFADGPSAGIVLQAYLRDSEELLEEILARVAGAGRTVPLTVRLVKGAYWDHETIEASQHGWDPPVWTDKAESDRCFERLTRRLIDAYPLVRTAVASHNLRSVAHAVAYAGRAGLEPGDLELQVLRGLGDDLQEAIGPIAPSATWSQEWLIWSAACSRTPPTRPSWSAGRPAPTSTSCYAPHDRLRQRAAAGAAPLARARAPRRSACRARRAAGDRGAGDRRRRAPSRPDSRLGRPRPPGSDRGGSDRCERT
jgi:proline dehydrogenase